MIAAAVPKSAIGNTLPLVFPDEEEVEDEGSDTTEWVDIAPLLLACWNSLVYDYVARQKVQSTHLNWYIVEQLPVVPPQDYERRFGSKSAAEIVKDAVLRLTYTAHDMGPFARDMGYEGPPFPWDEEERRHLRAKLDALYFILYGVTDRDDVNYIFSTFPIVQREDEAATGRYTSRDLCLAYMNALEAGDPDARVAL